MLKSLRKKLTLICVITTGILLSSTTAGILLLSENQIDKQSALTFQNNLNSIVYKIQSSHVIDTTWLSQLETGNRLIVHIEDNGVPMLYQGSWTPKTDRSKLISAVQSAALEQYGFDAKAKPYSVIDVSSVAVDIKGAYNDQYQAAVLAIPSYNGNWQSITVLRDVSAERSEKLFLRLTFIGLIVTSVSLLYWFSWWFAGRAIKPIEESQRKQVEFIAAASHELRSPLAVIQASVSALNKNVECLPPSPFSDSRADTTYITATIQDSAADAAQKNKFLNTAERECRRMARLIDDLLFLASTDAGTWTVRTESIEPDTLMTELYESFSAIARKKGQRLTLTLPEDEIKTVAGDRQRLFQALVVLTDNAMSYTPEGGSIALSAREERRSLLLSVSDDGPGISNEKKKVVFDRFYCGDPSRNKKEHYGLGLSVAKEICELHGGVLAVSDTPGGGATFTITLPPGGVKN